MKKYTSVPDFLNDLDAAKREEVTFLRRLILALDPELTERIKWNAPSYALNGADRITFGMNKVGITMLVLHLGTTRKETPAAPPVMQDNTGLVEWKSDIRGIMAFADFAEIQRRAAEIADVLGRWLRVG